MLFSPVAVFGWVTSACGILWAPGSIGAESVWYVDLNATGPVHDGSSWCNAFTDLQDALGLATAGDEVRVADARYTPDRGTGDRIACFRLFNGVAVYGGFAGCGAPDPDERDIVAYETILSGDLNGDDGPDFNHYQENSYHVVTGFYVNGTARLDGLTISGGNADDTQIPHDAGGGMRLVRTAPTIVDCTFIRNVGHFGGGMENYDGSAPAMTNCLFTGNASTYRGGGMHCNGSYPTLIDCDFVGNVAENSGGGIRNMGSNPTLTNCSLVGNSASFGGGMVNDESHPLLRGCHFIGNVSADTSGGMHNWRSSPTLSNCDFRENIAFTRGGGMYNLSDSIPTLTDCLFDANVAQNSSGGGVHSTGSTAPTFVRCTFSQNSAGTFGGGAANAGSSVTISHCRFLSNLADSGAGIWNYAGSALVIADCLFSGNAAVDNGGAMDNSQNNPTVTNCTFANNVVDNGRGGGIWNANDSHLRLTSCILWDNRAGEETGEAAQIDFSNGSAPIVSYTCIQGWTGDLGGVGNIGDDPMFKDPSGPDGLPGTEDDNLRLSPDSAAINSGDPLFEGEPEAADLDGHARVFCHRVDMGAYEFGAGDFDCDHDVDLFDFARYAACVTGPDNGPYQDCGINPAANSCQSDDDCGADESCLPVGECIPGDCICDPTVGDWICTEDCADQCQTPPCGVNPAATSCASDADCAPGELCLPYDDDCIPSECICDPDQGGWGCTDDCSPQCQAAGCEVFDFDLDLDVDFADLGRFQVAFTGP